MVYIVVTELVSHDPMPWLNDEAEWNTDLIVVTELVSHAEMSWSNEVA